MNDHAFYLWMSYGATAVAMFAELIVLGLQRARSRRRVDEERELEAQD